MSDCGKKSVCKKTNVVRIVLPEILRRAQCLGGGCARSLCQLCPPCCGWGASPVPPGTEGLPGLRSLRVLSDPVSRRGQTSWALRGACGTSCPCNRTRCVCVCLTIFQNIIVMGWASMEDLVYFPAYLMLPERCSCTADCSFITSLVKEMFLSLARSCL